MLRALIERNITPDFVVGVSIGAWNGAWLAHRPDLEWVKKLEEVWRQVTRRTLDMVWWRAARNMVRRKPSLYEGGGLSRFVAGERIAVIRQPMQSGVVLVLFGRRCVVHSRVLRVHYREPPQRGSYLYGGGCAA